LGTAEAQDVHGVLYGLPLVVVLIGREEFKHMAELVEKCDDLSL
jgi:hypothetical protein